MAPPPHDIYHRIFFGGGDGKVRPAFTNPNPNLNPDPDPNPTPSQVRPAFMSSEACMLPGYHPYQVRPAFMSSETFMKLHVQFHKVGVARFPTLTPNPSPSPSPSPHPNSNPP